MYKLKQRRITSADLGQIPMYLDKMQIHSNASRYGCIFDPALNNVRENTLNTYLVFYSGNIIHSITINLSVQLSNASS